MKLPEEYIVTDSRELFKKKRLEYKHANPIEFTNLQLEKQTDMLYISDERKISWKVFDIDAVRPLNGKYFVDGYPEDDDIDREEKIANIGWNSPSDYVCSLMSYFWYVDIPRGYWNQCIENRHTAIIMLIDL